MLSMPNVMGRITCGAFWENSILTFACLKEAGVMLQCHENTIEEAGESVTWKDSIRSSRFTLRLWNELFSEHWSDGYDVCTNSFLYTMHNKLSTSCTCTCEQHFCALWSLFNCLLSLPQPSILIFWMVTPEHKLKCSTGELCSLKWNGTAYFLQIKFVCH